MSRPSAALAVIRSPWDYVPRRAAFVAWAHGVPRLLNPADIIEWNTDKRYLGQLAQAGLPVTPTEFVEPGDTWTPPQTGEWVVKPTISAGSQVAIAGTLSRSETLIIERHQPAPDVRAARSRSRPIEASAG